MQLREHVIKQKKFMKNIKTMAKFNTGLALISASIVSPVLMNQYTPQIKTVHATGTVQTNFLNLVADSAKRIAKDNGLYASVMIAQAALESGWGQSTLSQAPIYNLFGIKGSYNGESHNTPTLEDDGTGNYYQIYDNFRKYNNYSESLQDYANLLTGDNDPSSWRYSFYQGARMSHAETYQDATAYLTGRYATDTRYGSKLNAIIEQYNLTRYDVNRSSNSGSNDVQVPSNPTPSYNGVYVVKSGDSLYRIALNHGMTIEELQKANGLTSYLIVPGQSLIVNATTNGSTNPTPPTVTKPVESGQDSGGNNVAGSTYVVKRGDSLYSIARIHGISLNTLLSQTGLTIHSVIHPGQVLNIHRQSESNVTPPAPSTGGLSPDQNTSDESVQTTPSTPNGTYIVQRGEGLYSIATRHGMTLDQLKALNGLTSNLIHPGQVLQVSTATAAYTSEYVEAEEVYNTDEQYVEYEGELYPVAQERVSEEANPVVVGGTHIVQAGDTLYSIAQRYGLDVNQLIQQNGSSNIYVGQVINF